MSRSRASASAVAGAGALAAFGAFTVFGVIGAFSCHGTDASAPPADGSLGDALCGLPLVVLFVATAAVGLAAPFVGSRNGVRGAVAGATASAAALPLLALAYHAAFGSTWNASLFVGGPVVAIAVGLLVLRALSRDEPTDADGRNR